MEQSNKNSTVVRFADVLSASYAREVDAFFAERGWELQRWSDGATVGYQVFFGAGVQVDNNFEYGFPYLYDQDDLALFAKDFYATKVLSYAITSKDLDDVLEDCHFFNIATQYRNVAAWIAGEGIHKVAGEILAGWGGDGSIKGNAIHKLLDANVHKDNEDLCDLLASAISNPSLYVREPQAKEAPIMHPNDLMQSLTEQVFKTAEPKLCQVGRAHYTLGVCDIQFSMNARYDLFDGKYHPGWLVTSPGEKPFVTAHKEAAISYAKAQLNKMESFAGKIQDGPSSDDENYPKETPEVEALRGEISNLRHELKGVYGYAHEEEYTPSIERRLLLRECQLCAALKGVKIDELRLEQLVTSADAFYEQAERAGSIEGWLGQNGFFNAKPPLSERIKDASSRVGKTSAEQRAKTTTPDMEIF